MLWDPITTPVGTRMQPDDSPTGPPLASPPAPRQPSQDTLTETKGSGKSVHFQDADHQDPDDAPQPKVLSSVVPPPPRLPPPPPPPPPVTLTKTEHKSTSNNTVPVGPRPSRPCPAPQASSSVFTAEQGDSCPAQVRQTPKDGRGEEYATPVDPPIASAMPEGNVRSPRQQIQGNGLSRGHSCARFAREGVLA